jgi:putative transposase
VTPADNTPSRRASPRALTTGERQAVLDQLHEPRFADRSPTEVYATLLDEGVYFASERTFYRLLAEKGETRE